jgi:hypothetical protein
MSTARIINGYKNKDPSQNVECWRQNGWNRVPGLNSAIGNPLHALHRRPRFKFYKVSDFKFVPFPKTNFNVWQWTFHGGARDACVITRAQFPVICCDLGWFGFWLPMELVGCAAGPNAAGKSWREEFVPFADGLAEWKAVHSQIIQ